MKQPPRSRCLRVERVIAASPARLFEAWTTPSQLLAWWGPRGVRCTHAEVDPRAGGRYRIANSLPSGQVLWIVGEFLVVEPPAKLVYTWTIEPGDRRPELVTVRFEARGPAETAVIVLHEQIADDRSYDERAAGWDGCLERLAAHV